VEENAAAPSLDESNESFTTLNRSEILLKNGMRRKSEKEEKGERAG